MLTINLMINQVGNSKHLAKQRAPLETGASNKIN